MTELALTSSVMPFCTYVRNPGNEASRRYEPVGRLGNAYEPVSFDRAFRACPVAVCVAVISTPGNTAPLGSLIVPLISAVACAHNPVQASKVHTKAVNKRFMIVISLITSHQVWQTAP